MNDEETRIVRELVVLVCGGKGFSVESEKLHEAALLAHLDLGAFKKHTDNCSACFNRDFVVVGPNATIVPRRQPFRTSEAQEMKEKRT